ncbi:hypothetical protein Tco_0774572 [Tanacetum coccineum]|uniref:Uncharacterized protein n=1 Tax=Tanacetum coccineum TaxID=301880 RepID=A0ABQ4ZRF0_9ASTR
MLDKLTHFGSRIDDDFRARFRDLLKRLNEDFVKRLWSTYTFSCLLDNEVPYQLCDHICESYRFKNGITKLPTYSSYIDGFCNGGELPVMVRVGSMTYFQDHKWYDKLADGMLKEETLMHKAKVKESWGNATPSVMKFCTWLINSFGNFYELNYNVLIKLQECWWMINADEVAPFTRSESYGQESYVNIKTKKAHDPYLEINNIFDRNYDISNTSTQDNQGHDESKEDPTIEPSVCKIKRFEMMKYSFSTDEEYIAIKEKRDTSYQCQVFTRKRVFTIPNTAYPPSAIRHDFYGFMYDTDDDASISGKSCEHFGWDWPEKDSPGTEVDWQDDPLQETEDLFVGLDQSIQVVVVQNNVQQEVAREVVLYPPVHEDVVEEVIEMANGQAEALSAQEVADECLDDEQVKERRPSKRIRVTQ